MVMTARTAHVKPELFSEKVFDAISVDLLQAKRNVVSLPSFDQIRSPWARNENAAGRRHRAEARPNTYNSSHFRRVAQW